MFAKKLVFIAAAVALAMTPAVALDKQTAHVKIHIVHGANHKQVELAAGLSTNATWSRAGSAAEETAVGDDDENEEEEDDDSEAALESSSKAGSSSSAKGDADVGDEEEEEGADEADEVDEESGENEDAVVVDAAAPKNGTAPASPLCTGKDESPMSVEGVEGIFCVTGQACVADIVGACPGKQDGLPLGAYCGKVQSGVLGCKPNTEETLKHAHKYHAEAKNLAKALDVKYQRVVKKISHKKH